MVAKDTKVLIIDDEEGVREMFREVLQQEGYLCETASGGLQGLEALAKEPFDLVLVDIMMPQMNGLTFFEHMKVRYPGTIAVFITAVDDVSIAVRNLKQGAYDYLVKPVSMKRLLQAVQGALEKRSRMLEENRLKQEREGERERQLEQRSRELRALNSLFQRHLQKQSINTETYSSILDSVQNLARDAENLAELVRSQLSQNQQDPPAHGDSADSEPGEAIRNLHPVNQEQALSQ